MGGGVERKKSHCWKIQVTHLFNKFIEGNHKAVITITNKFVIKYQESTQVFRGELFLDGHHPNNEYTHIKAILGKLGCLPEKIGQHLYEWVGGRGRARSPLQLQNMGNAKAIKNLSRWYASEEYNVHQKKVLVFLFSPTAWITCTMGLLSGLAPCFYSL